MQSLVPDPRANCRGVVDALVTIFRFKGIRNTVRGTNAVIGGAGPAHALYFACYEHLKNAISNGHQGNHIAQGAVGCVSTLLHDMFMNPAEDDLFLYQHADCYKLFNKDDVRRVTINPCQ